MFAGRAFFHVTLPLARPGLIRDLREATRTTTIMVTYDLNEACLMADHLAVLHRSALQQTGTLDDLRTHPATVAVADLGFFPDHAQQVDSHTRSRRLIGGTVTR